VHYVAVVLAGEYITGPSHIGRQLIHFVKRSVQNILADLRIAEIADYELICLALAELVALEVNASDPEPLPLQPFHQMTTDESSRSTNEGTSSVFHEIFLSNQPAIGEM
jgi:hypothetical protein